VTIPTVTRFDDFRFALYDLTAGTQVILNPDSVIDPQFETVPGVGGDRLKSCTFDIPWYANARSAFDFDHLQLLAIGRYGVDDQELWAEGGNLTLWGVVLKPKEGYSARVARDTIQIQAVQVEELLKCRKVFEYVDAENKPLVFVNAKPDNIAKEMVRRVFTGVDVDGNARTWEWGTLTVEADSGQCVDSIGLTVASGPDPTDTLYKRIDDLARTYDFDYQLVPSLSGGAWTFTFKTQAPYGGSDLTTGDNQVQIKDLYNLVPNATHYRDAAFRTTRMYISGYRDSVEDATAITDWGLWEGLADGAQLADAEIALEKARVKKGAEYGFEATGANGMVTWLTHFKAGDKVNRINNRLGIAADSEKIAAVIGRFQNKVLQLTIRWGDREPASTDRQGGGAYDPDEDGGQFLKVALPVGNTASYGVDPTHKVYGDHIHPLSITADDKGVMTLTNGVGNIVGINGITTSIVGGNLTIDGSGAASSLWTRFDAGSSDYALRPTTYADDIRIKADANTDVIWLEGDTGKSHFAGDMYIGGAAGVADSRLHIYDDDEFGARLTFENASNQKGQFGVAEDGGAFIATLGAYDISFIVNGTQMGHAFSDKTQWAWENSVLMAGYVGMSSTGGVANTVMWSLNGLNGNFLLNTGATITLEGTVYRAPLAVGTTGQVLTLTTGSPNQLSWAAPAGMHNAVTLSAALDANLLSLSTQELGLDTQTANYIFAGPVSGAAAAPTFRAMVAADLVAHTHDYVPTSRTVTAGAGLTGGGALSGNISLAVGAGTGITVNADDVAIANTAVTPGTYGDATHVAAFTVDQQGRLTAASETAISFPACTWADSGTVLYPSTAGRGIQVRAADTSVKVSINALGVIDAVGTISGANVDAKTGGGFTINNTAPDGQVLRGNGTRAVFAQLAMSDLSDGHAAVTLSAALGSNLLSLSTQELGLDTQAANYVFAGPTSGAAAAPTFRAMVAADLVAHDIIGAQHTYTGGAALDVFGLSAANTLARLTPSAGPGAVSAILKSDASGYLTLVRLQLGDADYYVTKSATPTLLLNGGGYGVDLAAGGAAQVRVQDGFIFPVVNNDIDNGTTTYRWKSVNGIAANFSGDVTLAATSVVYFSADTNLYRSAANMLKTDDGLTVVLDLYVNSGGRGIIMATNTAGLVLAGDGTRYSPKTPALIGHTGQWDTTGYSPVYTSNPLRKGDGTQLYMDAGGHLTTTAAGNIAVYIGSTQHVHPLTTDDGNAAISFS
jgi:hypothetical protein